MVNSSNVQQIGLQLADQNRYVLRTALVKTLYGVISCPRGSLDFRLILTWMLRRRLQDYIP